jgi:hypothetical protein
MHLSNGAYVPSFILGTSSTLFNAGLTTLDSANSSGIIVSAIESVLERLGRDNDDISAIPNSFRGYNPGTNPVSHLSRSRLPRLTSSFPTSTPSPSLTLGRPTRMFHWNPYSSLPDRLTL